MAEKGAGEPTAAGRAGFRSARGSSFAGLALRWRIVGLLLLVSLLPVGLVSGGSWVVFGRLLAEKSLQVQRSIVQGHARAIEIYLEERLRALELVARGHSLGELDTKEGLQRAFESLSESYRNAFVDLGVISDAGRHLAYVGPYDLMSRDYQSTEWFRDVLAQGTYVSDVFLGYRQVPHFVVAVRRKEGGRLWVLRATINSEKFHSLVRTGWLDDGLGDAFIVNSAGRYQTPPRRGQVLQRSPIKTPELHRGVQDNRALVEGEPVIRVTTWLNNNRWMLVVQQDEREVRRPVNRALLLGGLVTLLAIVIVGATTVLATWHLTNQIDRANEQRDALSRDLLRSAKLASLGEMSSGLAHEINNPLAIIGAELTNITDVISVSPETNGAGAAELQQEVLDSVRRCKRQVERCGGITAKMLQFGRRRDATPELTDIVPRLNEVVRLMAKQAEVRNIDIALEVESDLPRVVLDATELEQVIVNLINNAFFAMKGGGRIQISARRAGSEVQLAVRDTGGGIPPQHLERIFQPFFTTKPVGQGTGLGLSVCHGIVRNWGGSIEAESEPGAGTVMTIHLPVPGNEPVSTSQIKVLHGEQTR